MTTSDARVVGPRTKASLRRANPLFLVAIGALLGASVVAVGRQPKQANTAVATGAGGTSAAGATTEFGAAAGAPGTAGPSGGASAAGGSTAIASTGTPAAGGASA